MGRHRARKARRALRRSGLVLPPPAAAGPWQGACVDAPARRPHARQPTGPSRTCQRQIRRIARAAWSRLLYFHAWRKSVSGLFWLIFQSKASRRRPYVLAMSTRSRSRTAPTNGDILHSPANAAGLIAPAGALPSTCYLYWKRPSHNRVSTSRDLFVNSGPRRSAVARCKSLQVYLKKIFDWPVPFIFEKLVISLTSLRSWSRFGSMG